MASAGVNQARSNLAAKGVVQTGLVAANAGVDLVRLARSGLVDELGVGQEGPRHRNHIGHAVGQYLLGHLGGVDAVGGDQRNAHLALELLRNPGKCGARHLGGDGGNARLVPANAGVQNGDAGGLQGLGELHHLFQGRAAFDQIEHGQAKDHDEIGTHLGPCAAHDFQRKADAVLITAAPGVVTVVGVGGDEFVDEVALRAHDLHAVVARTLRQACGAHKVFNGLLYLFGT